MYRAKRQSRTHHAQLNICQIHAQTALTLEEDESTRFVLEPWVLDMVRHMALLDRHALWWIPAVEYATMVHASCMARRRRACVSEYYDGDSTWERLTYRTRLSPTSRCQ